MENLEKVIMENRPKISASSLKTYISILKNLYYKHHEKDEEINLDWFNKQQEIIKILQEKPAATRKTIYAALIAITKDNDEYKKALLEDGKTYSEFIKTKTKTEKQSENWKEYDEIKNLYEKYYVKNKPLLSAKHELNDKDYFALQDFIILSLTTGYWIPPRRSEWVTMKAKNYDVKTDNYIDKKQFVFNHFKTSKYHPEGQRVQIPKGLKLILNKWISKMRYDYLITDTIGKPYSNVRLTQKLNSLFDGKIGTSMLRHI